MGTNVTLTIPQSLYRRAEQLAWQRNKGVIDVLDEAVSLAESELGGLTAEEVAMEREEVAYRNLQSQLLSEHENAFVAIFQGQLIDVDTDEIALLRRIKAQYPHVTVLVKQVKPLPEKVLHFRSPRFVPDDK